MDDAFISTLSYGSDGSIKSSVKQYDDEINSVLNLNHSLLKRNRKSVKDSLLIALGKNNGKNGIFKRNWTNTQAVTKKANSWNIAE